MPTENISIGIISSTGLGDTFLQMVIANNLARNGYQVSFFSDIAHGMSDYISGYSPQPFPNIATAVDTFESLHIVLYDCASQYLVHASAAVKEWLKCNGVGYQMSSGRPDHFIEENQVAARLPSNMGNVAKHLLNFNTTIRSTGIGITRPPLAQQAAIFLEKRIKLQNVTADCGLALNRKNVDAQKVLIHPSSSKLKKNWNPEKYIALADRLSAIGYQPVITVAPNERDYWKSRVNKKVTVPVFNSITELALFYQDANWFVGNDSGNAHLASAIGVPTFQIFGRWRNSPSWRAGWSEHKVMTAAFPYSLSKQHWQSGLSVDSVYRKLIKWVDSLPQYQHIENLTG